MSRRVVITKHRRWYPVLRDFKTVANTCQDSITIELLDPPQEQRVPFFSQRLVASELRAAGLALKAYSGLADDVLLVILVDSLIYDDWEDDEDLFSLNYKDLKLSTPELAIVSLNYLRADPAWHEASYDQVADSIILNLLCSLAENLTDLRTHTEPTGCVMDYCYEMSEILYALQNKFAFCIRHGCLAKLQTSQDGRAIVSIATSLGIEPRATPEQLREIEEGNIVFIKPIWKDRHLVVDDRLCFVIMPIGKGWTEGVWEKIRQIVEAQGLKPLRADEITSSEEIMNDIWKNLNMARVVIADLSGRSPNVFYELGIAHTLGKRCILLAQNKEDVPFDVAPRRILFYSNDAQGVLDLERKLPAYIQYALSG